MSTIVTFKDVSKRFGPVLALENLNLELKVGEVVGLVGQNGCGKSTLLKMLAGLQSPDVGEILVRGIPAKLGSPLEASRMGIGLVHQEQSLIPNLKVAENIFLDKPNPGRRLGYYSWPAMYSAAKSQLEKVEVKIDPALTVEELSFSQRQMVELAKVLAIEDMTNEPIVILFDEPTAVLAPADIELLFRQIRRLKLRSSIVFVSHRIDEIMEICDRIVVMARGRKVAEVKTADTNREQVFNLIVGHNEGETLRSTAMNQKFGDGVRLEVKGLSAPRQFADISFSLRKGEILGLAGGMGSGAEEVCRALFGVVAISRGDVLMNGKPYVPSGPTAAIAAGIGYVPSDRKSEGALKGRTVNENMTLTYGLEYGFAGMFANSDRERQQVDEWISRLKIVTHSMDDNIESLSGGNQQKVVMGKWLMSKSLQVLLLDHPTRGLDPGAREDLYGAIRDAAAAGLSIVMVGDTVEEILSVSDTIIVMKDGSITGRYDMTSDAAVSERDVVAAML